MTFVIQQQTSDLLKLKERFNNMMQTAQQEIENNYQQLNYIASSNDITLDQPIDQIIKSKKDAINHLLQEIESNYMAYLKYYTEQMHNSADAIAATIEKIEQIKSPSNNSLAADIKDNIVIKFKQKMQEAILNAKQALIICGQGAQQKTEQINLVHEAALLNKDKYNSRTFKQLHAEIKNMLMHVEREQRQIINDLNQTITDIMHACHLELKNAMTDQKYDNLQQLLNSLSQWIEIADDENKRQLLQQQHLIDAMFTMQQKSEFALKQLKDIQADLIQATHIQIK